MKVTVEVLTYKEGLMSRVAHDLKLVADSVVVDDDFSARIDASSLRVVCVMKKGREAPGTLSAKDLRSIQDSLRSDVLHTRRHPEIRFSAGSVEGDPAAPRRVSGTLHLHGAERPIRLDFKGGEARVRLHQPDFGIKPFSAMMGMLKVKPGVEVVVRLA
jgi:hypothetical protein